MGTVGKARNALLPINSLPEELTIDLLIQSIEDWKRPVVEPLWRLPKVQTSWWRCIKDTPQFWTEFSIDLVYWAPFKLRKSGSAPLNLVLDVATSIEEFSASRFLELLGPERHRWKTLESLGTWTDLLAPFLTPPPPLLAMLEFDHCSTSKVALDLTSLHTLCNLRVPLLFLPRIPTKLITLHIDGRECANIGLTQLHHFLQSLHSLRTLIIEGVEPADEDQAIPSSYNPVHLPSLEQLTLRSLPNAWILYFLSFIRSDQVKFLKVYDRDAAEEPVEVLRQALLSEPSATLVLSPFRHGKVDRIIVEFGQQHLWIEGQFRDRATCLRIGFGLGHRWTGT